MGYHGYYLNSRVPWPNVSLQQTKTYEVIASSNVLPVSLEDVKLWLKVDTDDDDELITDLIWTAAECFESYTNRILINKTFKTYANFFFQAYELRRSKLQQLISFSYLSNGVPVVIPPTVYYVTDEINYSRLIFNKIEDISFQKDDVAQSIIIDFIAGYGENQSDIPKVIQQGIKFHVSYMYANRGDCTVGSNSTLSCSGCAISPQAKRIYTKYRIASDFIDARTYRGN